MKMSLKVMAPYLYVPLLLCIGEPGPDLHVRVPRDPADQPGPHRGPRRPGLPAQPPHLQPRHQEGGLALHLLHARTQRILPHSLQRRHTGNPRFDEFSES